MPDDTTLGAALRQAREDAGLTVERVAAETRIRATLIRDLENDSFASSGGSVYARGHVKSIASTLHVDPAPLLALFDKVQGTPPELAMANAEPVVATSLGGTDFARGAAASLRPDRRGPRWGIALAGAAVVLVALIAIGSLPGNKPADQSLAGPTVTASPTTVVQPTQQATLPPDASASKPPITGAQLRVRIIGGSSWVSVSNAAGTTLFEGTLADGQFKDFTDARRLKVILGNSYVVSLNCGGKDSGVPGSGKVVRRYACTDAGLTAL